MIIKHDLSNDPWGGDAEFFERSAERPLGSDALVRRFSLQERSALASRLNCFRIGFYRKRVNRRFITTFKGTQFHENLAIYEF